jgi:hypothetical protein
MGVSEELPLFRFHDRETAAIYHPPHLRKCTRNLVLKHDVATMQCEITVNGVLLVLLCRTTNWRYMKLTDIMCITCCPQWLERHFKPGALNMIMVSLAAKIMSSSVIAAINALVRVGKDNNVVSLIDTVGNSHVYRTWRSQLQSVCTNFYFFNSMFSIL